MSGKGPSHPKDSPESLSTLSTRKLLLPEEDLEKQEASEKPQPSASAVAAAGDDENADADRNCKQNNERPPQTFYLATNYEEVAYSDARTSIDMDKLFEVMNLHPPTCGTKLETPHGFVHKVIYFDPEMDLQNNNGPVHAPVHRIIQRAAEAPEKEVHSEDNPIDSNLEANAQGNPTDTNTNADTDTAELSLNTSYFGPDTGIQDQPETVIQGDNPDVGEPAGTKGEPSGTVSYSPHPAETQPCDTDVQDPDNTTAQATNGAENAEQAIQTYRATFGKPGNPIERPRKVSFCGIDIDLDVPSTSWTDINLEGPPEASTSAAEPEKGFKTPWPVTNSPGAAKKNRLDSVDKVKATTGSKKGKASKNQRPKGQRANPDAKTSADAEKPVTNEPDNDDDNAEEVKAAKIDPKKRKFMKKLSTVGIKRGRSYSYLLRKLAGLEQAQRLSQQFQDHQWRRLVATQRRQVALQLLAQAHARALNKVLRKQWLPHWLQHLQF